jgi:hypothetical protein
MTVRRIKKEAELAKKIADMLRESAPGSSALSTLEGIRWNGKKSRERHAIGRDFGDAKNIMKLRLHSLRNRLNGTIHVTVDCRLDDDERPLRMERASGRLPVAAYDRDAHEMDKLERIESCAQGETPKVTWSSNSGVPSRSKQLSAASAFSVSKGIAMVTNECVTVSLL